MKEAENEANISKWLCEIDQSQRIKSLRLASLRQQLGSLAQPLRWFLSSILRPNIYTGYIDPELNDIVYNGHLIARSHSVNNDKVVEISTAAGGGARTWEFDQDVWIFALTASNATRAPNFVVDLVIGGVTATLREATFNDLQTIQVQLMGGGPPDAVAITNPKQKLQAPFFLQAGAQIVITESNFVAGDTMRWEIVYCNA